MTAAGRLAIACVVLAAAGCGTTPDEPRPDVTSAVDVRTARAAVASLPRVFEAGGVVQARTTAVVASRILAPVVSVEAAPGDRVIAGQRLVVLDARELDAQRRHAEATVAAAEHAVSAAEAELEGARAGLALAQRRHERVTMLHERGATATHELDLATAALRSAQAGSGVAEARLVEARSAVTAHMEAARAASATAAFAVVSAPFDGVITEKLVEPGNLAAAGTPLLRIEDARLRLEVRLDDSRAALVTTGQPVDMVLDRTAGDSSWEIVVGRVAEVSRAVESGSHTFLVKIDVPPRADLRSGMFARARFAGPARATLAVPRDAVVTRGQLPTVFVVESGRARMRVVSTGDRERQVEILAGLIAGEEVVVSPPPSLRDGDAVRVAQSSGS